MTTGAALFLGGMALSLLLLFGLAMTLVLQRTGGRPGAWRLRCLTCDHSGTVESAGGLRTGSWSRHARRIVRCSQCQRCRLAALEPGDTQDHYQGARSAA